MADNGGPLKVDPTQLDPARTIIITMLPTGAINVNCPQDEMLTRALLDKAHSIVEDQFRAMAAAKTRALIELPPPHFKP